MIDFRVNGRRKLVDECREKYQLTKEVERQIFWVRYAAFERGTTEAPDGPELVSEARERLKAAKTLCKQYPGTTAGMRTEAEDVNPMPRDSTTLPSQIKRRPLSVHAVPEVRA